MDMISPRLTHRALLLVACVVAFLLWTDTAQAQRRNRGRGTQQSSQKFDLDSWGQLGRAVRGSKDFYELSYYKKTGSGRKAKTKKTKAFLKIPAGIPLYLDLRIRLSQLKTAEPLLIFGRPITRDVANPTGAGLAGRDSQIQNAQVVLSGDLQNKLPFNKKYTDPRLPGLSWCEAPVVKSGGGLAVTYASVDTRVLLAKGAPVLKRVKADRKRLKSGMYVQLFGKKTKERPETKKKSDAQRECFEASMIVILDKRSLKMAYPRMWER